MEFVNFKFMAAKQLKLGLERGFNLRPHVQEAAALKSR